jgi:hypothetical protein
VENVKLLLHCRSWSLQDVEHVLQHYKAAGRFEPSAPVTAAVDQSVTADGLQPHEFAAVRTRWREFLHAVLAAEESRKHGGRDAAQWHPVTSSYAMERIPGAEDALAAWRARKEELQPAPLAPDYTDDELSDADSDSDSVRAGSDRAAATVSVSLPPPPAFDPSLQSPVFFGYSRTTAAQAAATRETAAAATAAAEAAMVQRQRERRRAAVARAQADAQRKRDAREKKVAEAVATAERGQRQRETELAAAKRAMSAAEFKAAKAGLDRDSAAAAVADRAALKELKLKYAALNK